MLEQELGLQPVVTAQEVSTSYGHLLSIDDGASLKPIFYLTTSLPLILTFYPIPVSEALGLSCNTSSIELHRRVL